MRKSLILIALVTGCGESDPANVSVAGDRGPAAAAATASADLTGLYEGRAAGAPNQLCIVERRGKASFGIVVWGANLSACGGAGLVERDGERLHFRMTGDQACTVDAVMTGGSIRLEGPAPSGCSYYCGARMGFDGASFERKGSTAADAMKAKDPAGDPLCSS